MEVDEGSLLLSSTEVCRRADVTFRQLDYLIRCGILTPAREARGSGTQRRFTATDLLAVWVAGRLGRMGAPSCVKAGAVAAVCAMDDPGAEALLVVDPDGVAQLLTNAEVRRRLEVGDFNGVLRLLSDNWTLMLPPSGLDFSPDLW
jgi:hypothetical protein